MSKLGYFLGGALAGIIGTAIAAYAVDACSSSEADPQQDLGIAMSESTKEEGEAAESESFAGPTFEEASPA